MVSHSNSIYRWVTQYSYKQHLIYHQLYQLYYTNYTTKLTSLIKLLKRWWTSTTSAVADTVNQDGGTVQDSTYRGSREEGRFWGVAWADFREEGDTSKEASSRLQSRFHSSTCWRELCWSSADGQDPARHGPAGRGRW